MDRKKIIINEIKYWKKNRLLPEQYCNFLLTLYTEGNETGNEKDNVSSKKLPLLPLILTSLGLTLFGLTFLVIYFTDFSTLLQTAIILSFSLLTFFLAYILKKYSQSLTHLLILVGTLMIFFIVIDVVTLIFPDQPIAILITVIVTCMIWLFLGKKYKLKYFTISGSIGLIVSLYFIIFV